MKHPCIRAILALATAGPGSAQAANVVVDWLVMQPGGTAAAFTLADDINSPMAAGALAITSGIAFPGLPATRIFQAGGWTVQPGFTNSATGDTAISALEFRVAPSSGAAAYAINVGLPSGQPLVLVVGGLLTDGFSETGGIAITALTDSGIVPVAALSSNAWANGLMTLDQPLDWNASTQVLSPSTGAAGDSQFAFFEIGPLSGANPRLSLSIPSGYASGTGDSIFFALGMPIPEPAASVLLALGAGTLAWRRKRCLAHFPGCG